MFIGNRQKHTNKRTKAKEPEGKGGKKDRHKTGIHKKKDNKATIQCVRQNDSTMITSMRTSMRTSKWFNDYVNDYVNAYVNNAYVNDLTLHKVLSKGTVMPYPTPHITVSLFIAFNNHSFNAGLCKKNVSYSVRHTASPGADQFLWFSDFTFF